MRTIKFKAWDNFEKKIISWEDLTTGQMSELLLIEAILNTVRYTALQFTGLCDKNGKDIYEGDIVAFTSRDFHAPPPVMRTWIGTIEFRKYGWALVGSAVTDLLTLDDVLQDKMEVVGSIYDREITRN